MCPYCHSDSCTKHGTYRAFGQSTRRFKCKKCNRTFNSEYRVLQMRDQKPWVNRELLYLLCAGVSQRRAALILNVKRETVARKIKKYGAYFRRWHEQWIEQKQFGATFQFDEMETFEHSKCKPLSIAVAVEDKTRLILSLQVASMPAKGLLAKVSRDKYGLRKDDRPKSLQLMMDDMLKANANATNIMSDMAPRYPPIVRKNFPCAQHHTFKGRRGCVVGQGELKAGGFDPLFTLNHTCAMIRDNIKRLTRRTWCTTKNPEQLQNLLNIYIAFHNRWLGAALHALLPASSGPLPATLVGAS